MESSWQSRLTPALHSSTMSVASSSTQEFGNHNQMEMNSGYVFHPHVAQDFRSTILERKQDPPLFNIMNCSDRSGQVDPAASFMSLLSGPPPLLNCDFQEMSNPKPFSALCKLPADSNIVTNSAFRGEVSMQSGERPSETPLNRNMQNVADFFQASRAMVSPKFGRGHDFRNFDSDKAFVPHTVLGGGNFKDTSLKERHTTDHVDAAKLHSKNIQTPQKLSIGDGKLYSKNIPTSQSSSFMSGCPRVFCFSTSGYLLLSNTGLLGIVCSCHCLHMSVFKFCEHAGLFDINPGDAVLMDSGDTISLWCKQYLKQFGIRVPEDCRGWDWPEELSATSGLGKSSATAANSSNYSSSSHLAGSPGGLIRNGQSFGNGVFSRLHEHKSMDIDDLKNKHQRNLQVNENSVLKAFSETSQGSFHTGMDNQIECPTSRCSMMSKFVGGGTDSGNPSVSGYVDSILRNVTSSTVHPTLQNLRNLAKDPSLNRTKITNGGLVGGGATSNIELRLGQPCQRSQASGNLAPAVLGPQLSGTIVNGPKSPFLEQLVPANCRRNTDHVHSSFVLNPNMTKGNLLNIGERVVGIGDTLHASRHEDFRGIIAKSAVVSARTSFHTPHEECMQSEQRSDISYVMPRMLNCEYNAPKCNPDDVPLGASNAKERHLNVTELAFHRIMDRDKVAGCIPPSSYIASDLGVRVHHHTKSSSSSTEIVDVVNKLDYSAICDKNKYSHHFSGVDLDASIARHMLNYRDSVPSFDRSVDTVLSSGPSLHSHVVSMGNPVPTSASISYRTPTLTRQEGFTVMPCIGNERLRFLAQEQDRFVSSSNVQNVPLDVLMSEQQRCGPSLTKNHDVFGVALASPQSSNNWRMNDYTKKLASMTGPNNFCNLSNTSQGTLVPSMDEEASLRTNKFALSREVKKCCQRVPFSYLQGDCSCEACIHLIGKSGSFPSSLEKQMKAGQGEPSLVTASKFSKDHSIIEHANFSCNKSGKSGVKLAKNIVHHVSQWRDVPNKVKEVTHETCADPSAKMLDDRGYQGCQDQDTYAKCFERVLQRADFSKEQEISNISSGCSAPAVTQASVEVTHVDSSFVNAAGTGFGRNAIVDEGSGIDKCLSSDSSLGSESAEFLGSTSIGNLKEEKSCKSLNNENNNQSSRSLLDELKLIDSLTWKKSQNQVHTRPMMAGKDYSPRFGVASELGKRKKVMKLKVLDASITTAGPFPAYQKFLKGTSSSTSSSKDLHKPHLSTQGNQRTTGHTFSKSNIDNALSAVSSMRPQLRKRDLNKLYIDREEEDDCQTELKGIADSGGISPITGRKKFRRDGTFNRMKFKKISKHFEVSCVMKNSTPDDGKRSGWESVNFIEASPSWPVNTSYSKHRPVVCGKYGEISCGDTDGCISKPAKIVSISTVLKIAKRCSLDHDVGPSVISVPELEKTSFSINNVFCEGFSDSRNEEGNSHGAISYDKKSLANPVEEMAKACLRKQLAEDSSMLEKQIDDNCKKEIHLSGNGRTHFKQKCREIRLRSIYELTVKGENSTDNHFSLQKMSKCIPDLKERNVSGSADEVELCRQKATECIQEQNILFILDSDAFCCVCGSSEKDQNNCLLDCSGCSIRVHQACYGVSKVPKGCWYCRPCKTGSKHIVCVLCGYGGGAMTRALRSQSIVKSLLKAWNVEAESLLHNSVDGVENNLVSILQCVNAGESSKVVQEIDGHNKSFTVHNSLTVNCSKIRNSITEGALDMTIKQWIHMVCGLWTPGTRCPNVDTMSTFDVSGVVRPSADVVCSMCNRMGGSCIKCRVDNCFIQFHPWCAHQKGLLQSEVEGVDNENVGFYGRCILHATQPVSESRCNPSDNETSPPEKEFTCARTESYKGRKREGFHLNLAGHSKGKGGRIVPQEQLNAWIHINGQRSSLQGPSRSDVENDLRKEYVRCKQTKRRKHLVVYKSGIHALGLYTSRFISRSEMVVEYVGEIVGQKVADKRENEYQFGRRLQYKSACYFFRIDKEHIIDATCKGGIARFVNHSCLPNCVAKVICIRNEKKVVFFAERDIFPGEEITYDYHFNHEDEGKKIPCLCNSRNCRRFLN